MSSRNSRFIVAATAIVASISFASVALAATGGPTVTLSSTVSGTTNLSSIPVTVTFSEPVTGFSSGGLTATNGGISTFTGSGANYSFDLNPSLAGTTTVVVPADVATSASSTIGNVASNILTFDFSSGSTSAATSTPSSPPVISNIAVNDSNSTNATISWTTDTPATSQVIYGVNTFYGATTAEDTSLITAHSQTFFGLVGGTTYHFYVESTNSGGTATSSDMTFLAGSNTGVNGGSGTTTTATSTTQSASSTPLAFTGVSTIKSNATADGVIADGWQWVLHFSVPSNENFLSMKFADFANTLGASAGTIPTASNIEFFSPQSTNAPTSANALTETNNDYTGWLDLAATSSPDQDVDVYVNVAVPSGTPTGSYSTTFGAFSNTSASTTTTP